MKKLIFIDPIYKKHISDAKYFLFDLLKEKLNFDIVYSVKPKIIEDYDLVIVAFIKKYGLFSEIANINSNVKIIGLINDLQMFKSTVVRKLSSSMMQGGNDFLSRLDHILCFNDETFREWFPQFVDKFTFFPRFIAPIERFSNLKINENPINKVFLPGYSAHIAYPLRDFLIKRIDSSKMDFLNYPRGIHLTKEQYKNEGALVGDDFAKFLNLHIAGIADSSKFNYVLAKYLEIAASGSLVLGEYAKDLDLMGFVKEEHYIPIDKDNVFEIIDIVLSYPDSFSDVRYSGRKLVLEKHTVNNRVDFLVNFFKKFSL